MSTSETAGADPGDPMVGRVLRDTYRIEALAGSGGMGRVYRAVHLGMGHRVAIKTMLAVPQGADALAERFELEARAVSRLQHPNTVRIFDFGRTDEGLLYHVMEFIDGRTVKDVLDGEGRFPEERALRVVKQVARSLAEAHAARMAHRDIKPANVFLYDVPGESDMVKVVDFGIVKLLDHTDEGMPNLTGTGLINGSYKYMAPEQCFGEGIDHRCDLYGLGCTLFEMLTGRVPFLGSSPMAVLMQHVQRPAPRLSDVAVAPTPEVEDLVARLLRKRPRDRPASAAEVVDRIDEILSLPRGRWPAAPLALRATPDASALPDADLETRALERPDSTFLDGGPPAALLADETAALPGAPASSTPRPRGRAGAFAIPAAAVFLLASGAIALLPRSGGETAVLAAGRVPAGIALPAAAPDLRPPPAEPTGAGREIGRALALAALPPPAPPASPRAAPKPKPTPKTAARAETAPAAGIDSRCAGLRRQLASTTTSNEADVLRGALRRHKCPE